MTKSGQVRRATEPGTARSAHLHDPALAVPLPLCLFCCGPSLKLAASIARPPDDDWVPPHPGYMVCALCRGKSGKQGRWGSGKALHPSNVRYPLSICVPCRRQHVPAAERAPPADAPPASSEADGSAEQGVWLNGTLRLETRGGDWDSTVVQLVHPTFGQIGH